MQTTSNLQELFSYSIIPLVMSSGLLAVLTVYFRKNKENVVQEPKVKEIPEKNHKNLPVMKEKYLSQLDTIEYNYTNDKIALRTAYQMISEAVRMFVFEVTDITTQNYSLAEIKKINIPILYELIEEYYEPEFASKSVGDFQASIDKARRVIKEWN